MKHSLKIKVCGLLHPENIEGVCALEPDFVGYIFYPGSKRYVGKKPDPAIFGIPAESTLKVGVFVNEEISKVEQIFSLCRLDMVQLHGEESPHYCETMQDMGIPVIKALSPDSIAEGATPEAYKKGVDYLLIDTPGETYGGTGRKFDWELLDESFIPNPFLLSGGIGPEDGAAIRKLHFEGLFGIDLNSRFELSPGLKDVNLLEEFMREIRK
ncbi:MAG: phosphoribosylanthranilate isomerase [Bacteroidota bacterium]